MGFGLTQFAPQILYSGLIVAVLLSIFWRPIAALYYLVPLIPLQTARYKMNSLPLGDVAVYVCVLAMMIGLLVRRESVFPKTPWNRQLLLYGAFTYVSLWFGTIYLSAPLPLFVDDPRVEDWLELVVGPVLLLLTAAVVKNRTEIGVLVALMCLSILVLDRSYYTNVAGRDFSHFSYDLRDEGPMGYAGVNGLAAFLAQATMFLLALAAFEKRLLLRLCYWGIGAYSTVCLVYTLSRAGYLAFAVGWLFLGIVKQRMLLVVAVIFALTGMSLVPNAARERVEMTYDAESGQIDHSSESRLALWEEALEAFSSANSIIGTGVATYKYTWHLANYRSAHNYFLEVLLETGYFGLCLFLWLFAKAFRLGFSLSRRSSDPFLASIGLALAVWVLTSAVANVFGGRWFLQVNGFMWVLGGLVARSLLLAEDSETARARDEEGVVADAGPLEAPAAGTV